MHVVDSTTKEHITTFKMNGSVEDIAFKNGGDEILSFGDDGMVYQFDYRSRRCMSTFADEVRLSLTDQIPIKIFLKVTVV